MNTSSKRTLLGITYYALILYMISLIVFFILGLRSDRVYDWAQTCYTILSILLALQVLFDISCNMRESMKSTSGIILIVLTFINIILSYILFGAYAENGAIPFELTDIFTMQIAMSYAINILAIIIYCVGERWGNKNLSYENKR